MCNYNKIVADHRDLSEGQKECPKCKKLVDRQEFNLYYGVCHECVENGGKNGK